jgi:hypothetical protein
MITTANFSSDFCVFVSSSSSMYPSSSFQAPIMVFDHLVCERREGADPLKSYLASMVGGWVASAAAEPLQVI